MPEFVLNTEGAGAPWLSLDAFTQGFIEAAFFSDSSCYSSAEFFTPEAQGRVHEGQADGSVPNDAGPAEIDRDSFVLIKNFCDEFQQRAAAVLAEAYESDYDETQAGRDLYFTRAGHGVGYWSREQLPAHVGTKLSEMAGRGEINLDAYEDESHASGFQVSFYIS